MDKQDKIVLKGKFVEFEKYTRNRPYYIEEEYAKHLRYIVLKIRSDKIKRIINKIK